MFLVSTRSTGMALMNMTGIMGVSSFSRESAMVPEGMSQRAPAMSPHQQRPGSALPVSPQGLLS